ncbi:M23 family metallopeptidase [Sphingomonas jatrophae]|uniref:Murein DD-endopeptidase MepM and murein hydrolase activator NlpD, contain LysM domain n=1 Tax=Sphingomonas jatrophae TaxID=1166337 RepID=A0A1I6JHR2_9SPHN|nr:M23 family metallopeptidase [Sphingomonas jatrophae]SFR78547.1 Murein DD-endopeptidase MepM and murein hydrolase activator NlpD, contain LysM domain [Sphingomonas jatrophae]
MRRLLPLLLLLGGCIPGARPDAPGRYAEPSDQPAPETRQEDEEADRPRRDPDIATTPPQVAKPRPAWTARAATADARDVAEQRYTVRSGDTLSGIADRTGASAEAIARANGLAPPFVIRSSQVLAIPGGRYHLVRSGETGIAIARAYGIEWSRIVAANGLEEPFVLRSGQRLLLPTRPPPGESTLEQRAAAFRLDIDDIITGSEPALAANAKPAAPVATARKSVPATVPVAQPTRFAGRFDWPLSGPLLSRFGPQGGGRVNEGINIAVPAGTPIRASADGVVAYVGSEIALFGGLILLKHGGGWITTYAHAQELLVTRGQQVKRGQVIARAGETGSAREPQLHFEIRQGRKPVNPLDQLPKRS